MSRPDKDTYFMALASVTSSRSTCLRRAVGCVLVDARGHVLATGYNGVAVNQPHCNEEGNNGYDEDHLTVNWFTKKYPHACPGATAPSGSNLAGCGAIHAEQNALVQCRDPYSIEVAYVTTSPCDGCVKLLLGTSCRRIVFMTPYPGAAACQERWEAVGRAWQQLEWMPVSAALSGLVLKGSCSEPLTAPPPAGSGA